MSATIRGPKIPLGWGTVATSGYVTDRSSEDTKTNQTYIEDEIGDPVTEITNVGNKTDTTLDVIALSGTTPPTVGSIFTWGGGSKMSVVSISKVRTKAAVLKFTISGNYVAAIHDS